MTTFVASPVRCVQVRLNHAFVVNNLVLFVLRLADNHPFRAVSGNLVWVVHRDGRTVLFLHQIYHGFKIHFLAGPEIQRNTSHFATRFTLVRFVGIILRSRRYKHHDLVVVIQFVGEFPQMIAQRWFPLTLFHRVNYIVRILETYAPPQGVHHPVQLSDFINFITLYNSRRERSQHNIRVTPRSTNGSFIV